MQTSMPDDTQQRLAEAVRAACLEAALDAYEDAGIRGLCHEGRWEVAVQAIRHLDLDAVLRAADRHETEPRDE